MHISVQPKVMNPQTTRRERITPRTAVWSSAVRTPGGSWACFEDPQCPYCRQFEEVSGDGLRREVAAGAVVVEYRMRCFLGRGIGPG